MIVFNLVIESCQCLWCLGWAVLHLILNCIDFPVCLCQVNCNVLALSVNQFHKSLLECTVSLGTHLFEISRKYLSNPLLHYSQWLLMMIETNTVIITETLHINCTNWPNLDLLDLAEQRVYVLSHTLFLLFLHYSPASGPVDIAQEHAPLLGLVELRQLKYLYPLTHVND